jgi:hypothetical protein
MVFLFAFAVLVLSAPARAADSESLVTEPAVHPTLIWFATQLLPSPQIAAGDGKALFGMRWQVTPLLYSWGINRKLSPWRVLIAEPYVRQSGSIELYLSPEFFTRGSEFWDHWLLRPGVRAYFPLIEHGEYLSTSIGTSYQRYLDHASAAFEGGLYVLYGVFGVQLSYAPSPHDPIAAIATFRVRYF